MTITYFRRDGTPATEDEALENGILKSGFGLRGISMMRDAAGNLILDDAGQGAYELKISRSWCNGKPSPLTDRRVLPARQRPAPLSEYQDKAVEAIKSAETSQLAFEARISNAWRRK